MYGEQILGLVEVITAPKLLYQRQIYSVCNLKGQRLHCIGTALPPPFPSTQVKEHTVSSQRLVPLQLEWTPT